MGAPPRVAYSVCVSMWSRVAGRGLTVLLGSSTPRRVVGFPSPIPRRVCVCVRSVGVEEESSAARVCPRHLSFSRCAPGGRVVVLRRPPDSPAVVPYGPVFPGSPPPGVVY